MKKILSFILALSILVCALTMIALAANTDAAFESDGAMTFTVDDKYVMSEPLDGIPATFEARVKYPADTSVETAILSSYTDVPAKRPTSIMYMVDGAGRPMLYTRDANDTTRKYSFTNVDVYTGEWIDLAIVIDGTNLLCYVNGELKQTLAYEPVEITPVRAMRIGGDYRERSGVNSAYCRGAIENIAIYSDARTAEEIISDLSSIDVEDEDLIAAYDLIGATGSDMIADLSKSGILVTREDLDGGISFVQSDSYAASSSLSDIPETIEAVLRLPAGYTSRGGIIWSNYAGSKTNICFEINKNGVPRMWYENKTSGASVSCDVQATNINVATGKWTHLSVVRDLENEEWRFYVNGVLGDTVPFSKFSDAKISAMKEVVMSNPLKLGNDFRKDQSIYFKGELMSLAAYSDIRTEEEIRSDITFGVEDGESLLAYYDIKYADGSATIPDRSGNGVNMVNSAPTDSGETEGEGLTFDNVTKYKEERISQAVPHTVESVIKLPSNDYGHRVIISSAPAGAAKEKAFTYTLKTVNGVPRVILYYDETGNALEYRLTGATNAEVCTDDWVHLAVTLDPQGKTISCYVNGKLEHTSSLASVYHNGTKTTLTDEQLAAIDFGYAMSKPLNVGGTHATSNNAYPFTGRIKSVATYSYARSAAEIAGDVFYPGANGLLAYYDLEHVGVLKGAADLSGNSNDLIATGQDTVKYANETGGMVFNNDEYYESYNKFRETPHTFEAVVKLPAVGNGGSDKVIIGNCYGVTTSNVVDFKIKATTCQPLVYIIDRHGNQTTYLFDKVNVNTEYWEHVVITFDKDAGYAYCYLNGLLLQKLPYGGELEEIDWSDATHPHILGGNWESANFGCFNRRMKYTALYTDVLTADEVYANAKNGVSTSDENLLCYYDCTAGAVDGVISDNASGRYDMHYLYPFFDKEERDPDSYDYSFAVVGDTQLITELYPAKLTGLYDWIIANADAKKLKFVMGLGDICQNDLDSEWLIASTEIAKLRDAGIPQSLVCGGGHDSIPQFNKFLPYADYVEAYEGMIEYGFLDESDPSLSNAYHKFTVGETKYMVISLEWAPKSAHVSWANEVIAANPDYNVIVTTHAYLYQDGTRFSTYDYPSPDSTGAKDAHNGDELWDALIRKHENIVMVLSGHNAVDRIVKREVYGDHGNRIVEMLINPQETDTNYKGTGMVAMLYFSGGGKTVDVEYYSTDKLQYFHEENQFTIDMPIVSDDFANINQASVSVGKDISVNYYVHLSESYKDAVMRFTLNGASKTVTATPTENEGLYRFTYRGVAPQMMGEEILAELMLDGEVIDTVEVLSVESYLRTLFKMDKYELTYTAEACDALHALIAELLDYGAEAQMYKNYKVDELVNDGVSTENVFDADAVESVKASSAVSGESGAKFCGATVRFDNTTYIRFDFTLGTASLSDVQVTIGDKVYTEEDLLTLEEGKYSVYTDAISATNFAKAYTATLLVDGETAHTVTYSVNSYVKVMHSSESMGALAIATYHYGEAARAFAAALSSGV